MNRTTFFFGSVIIAVIALVLAVYYALPGVYHVLVSGSHPPLDPQPAHVALFGVITILAVLAALVNRPKSTTRR
jgi:ABC-type thiamin/hydroxymethylpyrimidine transport system permease subunit